MLNVMFHLRILHSLTIDGNSNQDAVNTRNDSQHNAFAQLATVYFWVYNPPSLLICGFQVLLFRRPYKNRASASQSGKLMFQSGKTLVLYV